MSRLSSDWRAALDDLDATVLDEYQSGFPVARRPFRQVGRVLGAEESAVRESVEGLLDRGILRRFGPVLNPPVIGSSTLAAMQVPADRFAAVADVVNEVPQVNHNYARDHAWNMWFVVTAASLDRREAILADIEERTGLAVLTLPMLTDYFIDLEFPVVNEDRVAGDSLPAADGQGTSVSQSAVADLSALERRLLLRVQEGLPLSSRPYRDVATDLEASVEAVLGALESLLDRRCIKRIGCVVDHAATGFDENCMVVWDVPEGELDDRGARAGSLPSVTLCYHRPRRPEQGWPYNLFTMIHGREAAAVEDTIDRLAAGPLPFDHERLHTTETLKQTGARYEALVG